jgi:hypothetical protein
MSKGHPMSQILINKRRNEVISIVPSRHCESRPFVKINFNLEKNKKLCYLKINLPF